MHLKPNYNNKPQGLLLVVCCILSFFVMSCGGDKISKKDAQINAQDVKIDKADSVTLILSQDGKVKAKLQTKEFIQNDAAKPPYLDIKKGLIVYFYNDSGKVESTLTGDHARYYQRSGNILVEQNVKVKNDQGDSLMTEQLIWNNKMDKFYTEKEVTIDGPNQHTKGTAMEANRNFTWFRIYNQKGKIPVDPATLEE